MGRFLQPERCPFGRRRSPWPSVEGICFKAMNSNNITEICEGQRSIRATEHKDCGLTRPSKIVYYEPFQPRSTALFKAILCGLKATMPPFPSGQKWRVAGRLQLAAKLARILWIPNQKHGCAWLSRCRVSRRCAQVAKSNEALASAAESSSILAMTRVVHDARMQGRWDPPLLTHIISGWVRVYEVSVWTLQCDTPSLKDATDSASALHNADAGEADHAAKSL